MSLYVALNNALTGLNVNQRQLALTSQNISNANTAGYSRQVGQQEAIAIDGLGAGVRISEVTRKVDIYLQRSIRLKTSDVGGAEAVNDYLERAQILLGRPGGQDSIDEKVNGFFDALQRLAETPDIPSRRTTAVSGGFQLAQDLSSTSYSLNELRYQADRDINESVSFINDQLRNLTALNTAINRARALGNSSADLEDQQDQAIRAVAQYMNVQTVNKSTGEVFLYAPNGIPLVDESTYQLQYSPIGTFDVLTQNGTISALQVFRTNANGTFTSDLPYTLATAGTSSSITTVIGSGKLKGLLDIRDKIVPDMVAQLDSLASVLRDRVNAIHNAGSGFPGANTLSGTREIIASTAFEWSGKARIGLVDGSGNPITSPYTDETDSGGIRPLIIDFSKLNSGQGAGKPSFQAIIDEINTHFGPPQNKAKLGNLNSINLVTNNDQIPGLTNTINFDFELENIARNTEDFWVTGMSVVDNLGVTMGPSTLNVPQVALSPLNTYTTGLPGSTAVTVNTLTPHGYQNGQTIFLSTPPGGPFNGVPAGDLGGFFTISNVTTNGFEITVATPSAAAGPVSVAGQVSRARYDTAVAGEKSRTNDAGSVTANVAPNPFATFYDVTVNVATKNDSGAVVTSTITYRVPNNQVNKRNDRYYPSTVSGAGTLTIPSTNQTYMRAILVDKNGNEIGKNNGNYLDDPGFIKIIGGTTDMFISIDELDSKQLGLPNDVPPVAGTNRGFSHYFELNNFFKSNKPTSTGDTVAGSALNMAVESRIISDNNLISTGTLSRSNQPSDPAKLPRWTYQRFSGDNDLAQKLAKLGIEASTFSTAGGLPASSISFNGYAGQILGYAASTASTAESTLDDNNILLNGFRERSDAISGVNLDEELANTVIYQNAYSASARIISVVNQMFDELVNIIN
jgi:flagellar hook-associated protein 1